MARKHGFLLKADKDVAEQVFGPLPGRPTLSVRAGRLISDATGCRVRTGVSIFHVLLVVAAGGAALRALEAMQAQNQPSR